MHRFLDRSAGRFPHKVAVEEQAAVISYQELALLSDRLRDRLRAMGVRRGDRVGLAMPKSIDAVAALFGILKCGAAYVPVDPDAPAARNAYILSDCSVRAIIIAQGLTGALCREIENCGATAPLFLEVSGATDGLKQTLDALEEDNPAPIAETEAVSAGDLAYILYTSGSTGRPKGVMLSRRNAISFVDWCSEAFEPQAQDRFSSHAPFHFDLSILDIYVPIKHGATLVLVDAETGKDPLRLAAYIAEKRITSWYSTPSVLSILAQYGRLAQYDYAALRSVLFAGEVFPIKHLRLLKSLIPAPRYYNLYGPTETNVCTYYEIPQRIPEERSEPYPIGKVCSHLQAKVVDAQGVEAPSGQEGELCISGDGVMQGYWNLPQQTAAAFLTDASGRPWYKTGDIVLEDAGGNYVYVGRRDRMVKKRGYRVELGEIETALYRHPAIDEAAVIAGLDEEQDVRIRAFVCCRPDAKRPSMIELKRFCADNLPAYMIPDFFTFRDTLPKTSTDKTDYQKLKEL